MGVASRAVGRVPRRTRRALQVPVRGAAYRRRRFTASKGVEGAKNGAFSASSGEGLKPMAVDIGRAEFEAEGPVEAVAASRSGRDVSSTKSNRSSSAVSSRVTMSSTPTWLPRAALSTATSSTSPNCPVRVVQMQSKAMPTMRPSRSATMIRVEGDDSTASMRLRVSGAPRLETCGSSVANADAVLSSAVSNVRTEVFRTPTCSLILGRSPDHPLPTTRTASPAAHRSALREASGARAGANYPRRYRAT